MNAGEFERRNNLTIMATSTSIAKKARSKAEADFATWLMMAKLGGFDELPSNAQNFLTNYRTRLEAMSEAESTLLAVREVYNAYYSEMGAQRRAVQEAKSSVRSISCAQFDRANDLKIPPGPADFREHGGSDCRI
jgi:hypothetical protein